MQSIFRTGGAMLAVSFAAPFVLGWLPEPILVGVVTVVLYAGAACLVIGLPLWALVVLVCSVPRGPHLDYFAKREARKLRELQRAALAAKGFH